MHATKAKLLTIDDVAERWCVSVEMAVKMAVSRGVPYIIMGSRKSAGPKMMRFRLDSVEAWEKDQQVVKDEPTEQDSAVRASRSANEDDMLRAAGWDGVRRFPASR